ncbi:hypothetical protein KR044_012290 [Drosophila immigrans]|nr:hypothetical protein KR044_012290 [Drosophila immigrans]
MFRLIVVFSFVLTVIHGFDRFSVLLSPKSLKFTGDERLESFYVGDVLLAALGHTIGGPSKWSGMSIRDPFSLGQTSIIVILVRGVQNMTTLRRAVNYKLTGSSAESSLDYLVSQLPRESVNDIDFTNHREGMGEFNFSFGTLDAPVVKPLRHLHPKRYWSHKHFLDELGLIKLATNNLDVVLKPSHVLIFRLTLDRIVKVENHAPIKEAKALLSTTIANLRNVVKKRNKSVLMVQITVGENNELLSKTHSRVTISPSPFVQMSEDLDFPILINIVVWFVFTFALVVTVVCYAIATLDPGRDSLIYRVTNVNDVSKKNH